MSRRLQNRCLRCSKLLGAARTVDTGLTMKQDVKVKITKRRRAAKRVGTRERFETDRLLHYRELTRSAKIELLLHDFPVGVLADHFAAAKRVEVAPSDVLSRPLERSPCEGPF